MFYILVVGYKLLFVTVFIIIVIKVFLILLKTDFIA